MNTADADQLFSLAFSEFPFFRDKILLIAVLVIVMETINTPLCSWLQLSGDADRLNRRRLRNRPWSPTLPRLIDTMLIKSV